MTPKTIALAFGVAAASLLPADAASPVPSPGVLRPEGLRCEFGVDPLGIDVPNPRLFWRVSSSVRGARQSAWQVLVASSEDGLARNRGDLWDSGRVPSRETTHIPYAGLPLASSERVFWKLRVWDQAGRPSPWSAAATWTMGLVDATDWRGIWIAAPGATETLLLRREFGVRPGLRRAVVHVSGLGQYEMTLNGARVGEDLLSPGWTDYDHTTLYDTHDVTALLHEGPNAVGLLLGNGMYNVVRRDRFAKFTRSFGPLRAIVHLRLEYADGEVAFVGTDQSWLTHAGPITFSSIFGGEDHDARLERPGWNQPGFQATGWVAAVPVIRLEGSLCGHRCGSEPLRAIETLPAARTNTFPDGSAVYDFGQNASFMPRLRVSGLAGSSVRLTPAEVLNPDGTINRRTMGGLQRGSSWWQYTKRTDGEEVWFPRFYYVGSRYLHATGLATTADAEAPARVEAVESVVVHANAAAVGRFATSNERLNRIRDLVRWAQRSNMVSILTDCPHREKLGWLEQYHLNGPALRYEFDAARIFSKGMRDMADAQTAEGLVPNIAPELVEFEGAFRDAAEWGAAFIAVPWQQYQFTGDRELLRTHYDAMKRYFAYLERRAEGDLLSNGLGDWYDLGPARPGKAQLTPPPVTATAFFYQDARLLGQIAALLGRADDAKAYAARAEEIRASYNRRFFDREKSSYATGSQCANAMALVMGIVDPRERERVLAALVRDVESRGDAMTAGDIGFRYLLQALAEGNRSDLVYRMIDQDDKPGYGYQIKHGATSLTEAWDANLEASHNHFMLGHISEWFYKDLAGIGADPEGPGFSKILIRPQPVGDLAWVDASYDSIHGRIAVRWELSGERFTLDTTIPANTTATVSVPARSGSSVREGGRVAEKSEGVRFLRREGDRAIFAVESGAYRFESRW
jgi:alpha-L-rhamnosidase